MNKYKHLKDKAISLRKRNVSLPDICNMLNLPRTTVYGWIKEIRGKLQGTKKQIANLKKVSQDNRDRAALKRNNSYEQGLKEYDELIKKPWFKEFVMLYMGEGFRKGRWTFGIANSTLELMFLSHHWMKILAPYKKIDYGIQIHKDNDENEIKKYWAKQLNINKKDIKVRRKSNSGRLSKRNWRSVYGVLTMRFSDTQLKCRMNAWMQRMKDEIRGLA